jgi:zinc/manganese transport system permease protein
MDIFELSILGPALFAGLLVLSTHIPLGAMVLKRGIIFIDLAIAQMAGIGVIIADRLQWSDHFWWVQGMVVMMALLGAFILHWMERLFSDIQEALIGVLFVLSATLSLLLLANHPQGGEHLNHLLVGQIVWVSYEQLIPAAIIYSILLLAWFFIKKVSDYSAAFYIFFAIAVTVSVQLVGVYLVFASLIVPALITRHMNGKAQLFLAFLIGALGYIVGLLVSSWFDLPSGGVIVWSLVILGGLFSFFLFLHRYLYPEPLKKEGLSLNDKNL